MTERSKVDKRKTDRYGYPRKPRNVNHQTWFYEERAGLLIVRQIRNQTGVLVASDMFTLPWRFVLAAARTRKRLQR